MWAPLISSPAINSISKPSIRKHSSSDNLFTDHHHHIHLQPPQEKYTLAFSPVPPSPSRKAQPTIYTCICFIGFFFVVTIAAFLLCSNIDPPRIVDHASFSTNPSACCDQKGGQSAHVIKPTPALKGLGTVFTRGTKAMSDLVVAHITESTQLEDLRMFLRTLYRSGVIARADMVFLFDSNALPVSMVDIICEENHNFHKLLHVLFSGDEHSHNVANSSFSTSSSSTSLPPLTTHVFSNASISPFNAYKKASTENEATNTQTFWGCANLSRGNRSDNEAQLGWGSVVGFSALELNPDDTLEGFLDHPPLTLRRWACYQMLLGMVRHRFKHILLTDVSGVAILGDPFAMVRRKQGLYLSLEDRAWGASNAMELGVNFSLLNADSENDSPQRGGLGHSRGTLSSSKAATKRQLFAQLDVHQKGRRRARKGAAAGGLYERVYGKRMWSSLEEFEKRKKLVNSGAIVGGIHQIRGLANTMVTEIVKVALERAKRDAFPDNVLLSYLLHKSSSVLGKRVLDHLHLLDNAESFVHSLIGSQQSSLFLKRTMEAYPMIQGHCRSRRWGKAAQAIHEDICSSPADAMVYTDCIHTQAPRKVSFNPLLNLI
eukprot:c13978_g1_i1 orf=142-1947(-)